jgi:hypothetical protein
LSLSVWNQPSSSKTRRELEVVQVAGEAVRAAEKQLALGIGREVRARDRVDHPALHPRHGMAAGADPLLQRVGQIAQDRNEDPDPVLRREEEPRLLCAGREAPDEAGQLETLVAGVHRDRVQAGLGRAEQGRDGVDAVR